MSNAFKKFATVALLVAGVLMVGTSVPAANAATVAELMAQLAALQAQLAALQGSSSTPACTFTRSLTIGSRGADVTCLQNYLTSTGHYNYSGGATGYFGPVTRSAVAAWQAANGVAPAVGYFGTLSRAKYSALASVVVTPTPTPGVTPTPTPVPPSGVPMVALASDTAPAQTIADQGNMNFTKFTLSAGASALTVNSITVTRYGLTANADVENIKILDGNGVVISNTASLNSNSQARLTFTPALSIPAGSTQTFFIRAGITNGTAGGKTVALGINSAADINSTPSVTGTFPVVGNTMTTVALTIGSVTVDEDGSISDTTPDVGDTDVVVNRFKISAGSEENVVVEQIQVERRGTAAADDITNIELWDATNSRTIATVSGWDANGLATFNNLNLAIAKGSNLRFEIRVDIVDGAGLTINTDVTDGSEPRVVVRGTQYGFYITPTVGTWTGTSGQADSAQTINTGALTISKSSATPATGNVTKGSDRLIAVFDVVVNGEPVQVTSFEVDFDLGTMTDSEISNARLRNYTTGALLGGPNTISTTDVTANGTTYEASATFTDVMDFPVGTTRVGVYVDIADTVSANDTIMAGIGDADSDITAKGRTSNDSITAAPAASNVNGNVLTLQAGALSATTLTTPAARSVVVGTNDFVWAEIELSAANSGEDVNVTALVLEDTLGDAADNADDINNVEIWADLNGTLADSVRGDRYETKVSNTAQFADSGATDETLAITLSQTVVVPKNSSVRLAVVADLAAGATAGDTHTISLDTDSGDVTATGRTTGSTISVTPTGAGQTMTVDAGGTLTTTVDAVSPVAKLILDDAQGGKELLGVFRLAASNEENLELDSFLITDEGSDRAIDTYFFQAKSKTGANLGTEKSVVGGATAEVFWADGEVIIPANDFIRVYVYGYTRDIDNSAADNNDTVVVTVNAAGDVDTTGVSSGTAVDSTETNVDAATHKMYTSYPVLEWLSVTNTTLAGSASHLLAELKITAQGDEDVTFQNADGNSIVFQVTVIGDDTDTASETITFKQKDNGTTLDTGTITSASGTTEITVDFSSADLTVPAGSSRTIQITGDVSDLEDDGDSIQVWLDQATAADIDFGSAGANFTNAAADVIIRVMPSAFAQTHVNPS